MGIVVPFPTESARKRASLRLEEPARVIILPVIYIEQLKKSLKPCKELLLLAPLGGPPCRR